MLLPQQTPQVFAVSAFPEARRQRFEARGIDVSEPPRNFFRGRDLQALSLFDRLDEARGVMQRLVRAGVQPRRTSAEQLHSQRTAAQVLDVNVRNLVLAARGRPQAGSDI